MSRRRREAHQRLPRRAAYVADETDFVGDLGRHTKLALPQRLGDPQAVERACGADKPLVRVSLSAPGTRAAWSLSPAFDITWSYNPDGAWTSKHQMSMNGKRDGFPREDFRACARTAGLKRGRAELILDEVMAAVRRRPDFADAAQVAPTWRNDIASTLRTEIPAS